MGIAVMVVDDEAEIREAIRCVLDELPFSVVEAANGARALALLRDTPDHCVVLLDYMMPIMNGVQVLEALAADPLLSARHACILMSAASAAFTRKFAALAEQTRTRVLPKPFDVDELLDLVSQSAASLAGSNLAP